MVKLSAHFRLHHSAAPRPHGRFATLQRFSIAPMSLVIQYSDGLKSNLGHLYDRWAKYNLLALHNFRESNPGSVSTQADFARKIGADPAHVSNWRHRRAKFPQDHFYHFREEMIRLDSLVQFGYRPIPAFDLGTAQICRHPHPFFCVGMQYVVNKPKVWPAKIVKERLNGSSNWGPICDFDAACMYFLAIEGLSQPSWIRQIRTARPRQEAYRLARNALSKACKFADDHLMGDLDPGPSKAQSECFYPITNEHPRVSRNDHSSYWLREDEWSDEDAWGLISGLCKQWGAIYAVLLQELFSDEGSVSND